MPYPGAVFALVLGVAVGAAVYYYFFNDEEKPQQQRQNTYGYDRYDTSSNSVLSRRKKENCCTICLDEITVVTRAKALSCGHVFHNSCVTKWINIHKSCPNCRTYQSA